MPLSGQLGREGIHAPLESDPSRGPVTSLCLVTNLLKRLLSFRGEFGGCQWGVDNQPR